jgi:hypothetical protein
MPMINDSDGKNFPWYSDKNEVVRIKGPIDNTTTHTVTMNDHFQPHVTWDLPISNNQYKRLTRIKRKQNFLTWLVAMNVKTNQMIILRTIKWNMIVDIKVNPDKKPGKRAKLVGNIFQEQPIILDYNIEIPSCALYPKNANSGQILTWNPYNTDPELVVTSKYHFI